MGEHLQAIAAHIVARAGRHRPLHPLYVASALGLSVVRTRGLYAPALLVDAELHYDDRLPRWREVVGAIACGFALQKWRIENTPAARCQLARMLGTLITDDGTLEPADARGLH